jgi:hypothetical protein
MTSNAPAIEPVQELAHRTSDGIEVVLWWSRATGELTVCVSDERTAAYFEVAAAADRALDVFEHPYAYAAHQGLDYEDELLPNWSAAAAERSLTPRDRAEEPTR